MSSNTATTTTPTLAADAVDSSLISGQPKKLRKQINTKDFKKNYFELNLNAGGQPQLLAFDPNNENKTKPKRRRKSTNKSSTVNNTEIVTSNLVGSVGAVRSTTTTTTQTTSIAHNNASKKKKKNAACDATKKRTKESCKDNNNNKEKKKKVKKEEEEEEKVVDNTQNKEDQESSGSLSSTVVVPVVDHKVINQSMSLAQYLNQFNNNNNRSSATTTNNNNNSVIELNNSDHDDNTPTSVGCSQDYSPSSTPLTTTTIAQGNISPTQEFASFYYNWTEDPLKEIYDNINAAATDFDPAAATAVNNVDLQNFENGQSTLQCWSQPMLSNDHHHPFYNYGGGVVDVNSQPFVPAPFAMNGGAPTFVDNNNGMYLNHQSTGDLAQMQWMIVQMLTNMPQNNLLGDVQQQQQSVASLPQGNNQSTNNNNTSEYDDFNFF
ncbi:hypothetical protein ABK040_010994 [Willaertia magna]